MNLIKSLYRKYSDTAIFRAIGKLYRRGFFWDNLKAYVRMKRLSQIKPSGKTVRVAFICQYPQSFNKLSCVYEKMWEDDRYETLLLAVPGNIAKPDKENYDYFSGLYGRDRVTDAYTGKWYDLREYNPDYVFIQRPYDNYLPKEYGSETVSGYAKVCYVAYGMTMGDSLWDICLERRFFRNVWLFFAENDMVRDYNINRFKKSHKKGYRRSISIGYPVFEHFYKIGEGKSGNMENYKILWTPRWSEDRQLGGSNFLKYKDKVLELPDEGEGFELIFRPHPMTFGHMIETGKMTEEEVNDYIGKFEGGGRRRIDLGKDYAETFWDSDVLLTDISGIIPEYFITGKPIIYCETGAVPDNFFKEMLKVMYIVNSYEEAKERIISLSKGDDPMRDERVKKIEELLGNDFEHISERFLDEIYRDYGLMRQ